MHTTVPKNLVMLARMLERLDRSAEPVDAQQYLGVVEHLADELRTDLPREALDAVLAFLRERLYRDAPDVVESVI